MVLSLLVRSLVGCCFQSGVIMTTATMSILVVFAEAHSFAFLLGTYSEVELLDHLVILVLIF